MAAQTGSWMRLSAVPHPQTSLLGRQAGRQAGRLALPGHRRPAAGPACMRTRAISRMADSTLSLPWMMLRPICGEEPRRGQAGGTTQKQRCKPCILQCQPQCRAQGRLKEAKHLALCPAAPAAQPASPQAPQPPTPTPPRSRRCQSRRGWCQARWPAGWWRRSWCAPS